MFFIVAHHYVTSSNVIFYVLDEPTTANSIFYLLFGAFGKTGINCFLLITGYFMCTSNITAKKFAKLFFEVLFYRVVIYLVFIVSGYEKFNLVQFIKCFFPINNVTCTFTSSYLLFFLLIPFLNILIKNLTEKQHIYLLLVISLIYIIIGSVPLKNIITFNYVSWYCVLYFIASYIRLYPKNIFSNQKICTFIFVGSLILSILSLLFWMVLKEKFGARSGYYFLLQDSNKILAVTNAISGFLFFKNLQIKYNKFVNSISITTFGVLLIHGNSATMRIWLWGDILQNDNWLYSPYAFLHAILSVMLVFAVCSIIDSLRINYIEKPFFVLWDKLWPKVTNWFYNKENAILTKIHIEGD